MNVNTSKLAKEIAEKEMYPKAYKYDLSLREFDNKVELLGLVDEPTYDIADFRGREMLFPKKWVTLDVLSYDKKVAA
jgi:hypothetical protein